jgi:hypothetical protein
MIRYLQRDDIDDKQWDECIEKSFNGNIYAHSWYLDIVAESWGALVEGEYSKVFPLPFKRKMGISYIYQPFFSQQLGLFSVDRLDPAVISGYIDRIPSRFRLAELNLNTHNLADAERYKLINQLNHELDLINDYATISGRYSENLVRNLRKAEKAGMTLVRNARPEEVIHIFRRNRGKEFRHLREKDYRRLSRIIYTALHKGIADIRGLTGPGNMLLAGAVFVKSNRKAVFLFSGLTPEGREMGAMPMLIDSFIRENVGSHLTFDFDGSNDPNLARFYRSFGSTPCRYQRLYVDRLGTIPGLAVNLLRRIRQAAH